MKAHDQQRMEAVWRERADRLSRLPLLTGAGQNSVPVIVLGIGKERFGIELSDVAEVLPPVRPTPVPGAPAVFSGVINTHGAICPVLHLRPLLCMEACAETQGLHARVILLRKDGREMGLQIDSVEQIRWIGAGELQSAVTSNAGWSQHVKGSTKDLLMLISTAALFAELDSAEPNKGATT
jgi:purine-binding chemotaxis protein CheW